MDWVFCGALSFIKAAQLVVCYDIACQWSRHLKARLEEIAERVPDLKLEPQPEFEPVIPKFHIQAHGKSCQTRYSLNYRPRKARTNGENIETGWAWLNPAAGSTKEMGPGGRHDTIDDQWGYWNWCKYCTSGKIFPCYHADALMIYDS